MYESCPVLFRAKSNLVRSSRPLVVHDLHGAAAAAAAADAAAAGPVPMPAGQASQLEEVVDGGYLGAGAAQILYLCIYEYIQVGHIQRAYT
jgi:hypothetical protein